MRIRRRQPPPLTADEFVQFRRAMVQAFRSGMAHALARQVSYEEADAAFSASCTLEYVGPPLLDVPSDASTIGRR